MEKSSKRAFAIAAVGVLPSAVASGVNAVASFPGEANAKGGWRLVAGEPGKVVYIPFEGYYESKGGRIESPRFKLDRPEDENAYYRLTFSAKGETDGYWWVDLYDRDGNLLPDVNSRLYASEDWRAYDVMVPAGPKAVEAVIAFVSAKGAFARDVSMRRASVEEVSDWCGRLATELPKLDLAVPADAWAKPFDRGLLDEEKGFLFLQQAYERRAAARTGVAVWDLTTVPCEAIARSGKPLGWFKRDRAHNDDRGKQLIAQTIAAYFRAVLSK